MQSVPLLSIPSLKDLAPRLNKALTRAAKTLLAERREQSYWEGELSSAALSTATAVTALAVMQRASSTGYYKSQIDSGLEWLTKNVNRDGGWGDTILSLSNLSTTTLCWAAFGAVPEASQRFYEVVSKAEYWITQRAGSLQPDQLAGAIIARYGRDRTFSAPILTMCALAGRLGQGPEAWRWVIQLPFELAACPPEWFAALRLPVVSYALPALVAIGQARHVHRPTRNPFARALRNMTRCRTLDILTRIQPSNGGFLEATPLTSFVTMSLAGSGQASHRVARHGVEFLLKSQRADGSWPIDTNLATWVTTLTVNALGPQIGSEISDLKFQIRQWLLGQQYRVRHPYTNAAPGGWAWTDLPGGVPDADDTAGALIALRNLGPIDEELRAAATMGVRWLLDLQNGDGGIPTFCRGWGALPFDRSSADITAHAIRAWLAWQEELPSVLQKRVLAAIGRALMFLCRSQRRDGSWAPLWFGNQFAPQEENLTYGTARVLHALSDQALRVGFFPGGSKALAGATAWLLAAQSKDGSWGGFAQGAPSIEETSLALEALAEVLAIKHLPSGILPNTVRDAVSRGATWLIDRVESGEWKRPSPIGFYFAKLWYFERLYPLIFTVSALRKVAALSEAALNRT